MHLLEHSVLLSDIKKSCEIDHNKLQLLISIYVFLELYIEYNTGFLISKWSIIHCLPNIYLFKYNWEVSNAKLMQQTCQHIQNINTKYKASSKSSAHGMSLFLGRNMHTSDIQVSSSQFMIFKTKNNSTIQKKNN